MNSKVETIKLKSAAVSAAGRTTIDIVKLSPTQRYAYDKLKQVLTAAPVVGLVGSPGIGRTSILKRFAAEHRGRLIELSDVVAAAQVLPGNKWEEAIDAMVMEALMHSDLVIIDDYTSLTAVSLSSFTRGRFLPAVVGRRICEAAIAMGKKLVLGGRPPESWESTSDLFGEQAALVNIPSFTAADYEFIAGSVLGAACVRNIDFRLVYGYASMMQSYQLCLASQLLANEKEVTGEKFIEVLETYVLSSNTRTDQVEALSFDSLPGSEEIVELLETNIVLPFENRKLAQEMGLKPKRGVLLYGPPGTGKTSIGRALAHRMKGKFFLIDGSFISEPPGQFFQQIQRVVDDAKANSPSVLFIDDADVLFRIDHIAGIVRYLLSLLDGLESETASNVCVMMTAMDVRKIPEALLRSGRVELWLETKAPDQETRGRILQRWMGSDLPGHKDIDYKVLAEATESFTPADLRRIAGDAKSLYAADIVAERKVTTAMDYLIDAVNEIIAVRNSMAEALGDNSLRAGRAISGK